MEKMKNKEVHWVCSECGSLGRFLHLTVYKEASLPMASLSTYHVGECELCGDERPVTELRDFGYLDLELINWKKFREIRKGKKWVNVYYLRITNTSQGS